MECECREGARNTEQSVLTEVEAEETRRTITDGGLKPPAVRWGAIRARYLRRRPRCACESSTAFELTSVLVRISRGGLFPKPPRTKSMKLTTIEPLEVGIAPKVIVI